MPQYGREQYKNLLNNNIKTKVEHRKNYFKNGKTKSLYNNQ